MSNFKQGESAVREKWRQGLFSATNKPEIATHLAEFGYPPLKIKEGSTLMAETDAIWKQSAVEGDEATAAHAAFERAYVQIKDEYLAIRPKAKVIFRKEPETLSRLMLIGSAPESYVKTIAAMEKFYDELSKDTALCAQLAMLKITPASVAEMKAKIKTVQDLRYQWNCERSESERATEQKDTAMDRMEEWMDDFYAMAKLALADNKQYLEALGIVVKR